MIKKKSILLVEDDVQVRKSTKIILETNYHVLEAADYSQAIDKLKNPLDLAIIDYILPDYDGFELLKEIREIKPKLPVIMMTGYGTEILAIKAFRTGVTDYIKKPLDIPYLMDKIVELLGEEIDIKITDNKYFKNIESRDEFIVEGIARYIEESFRDNITYEKVLDMVKMDKNKFNKIFKKRFGQTFVTYLQGIRLRNAATLFKNPDLTIVEIACFVGYDSISHFNKVFKEQYGLSPSEYRSNLKQKD